MAYTYKHLPASLVAGAQKGNIPKDEYIKLFQETLNEQFYNSTDWWTVQEETTVGSATYKNVDVRINHVINAETGLKLGDDWKTLLFQNVTHPIEIGKRYIFDDNTWITINTEVVKNLTGTCTLRRCNNTLRWIDEPTGAFYEEPCCIEYLVKEPRNYVTQGSPFMTPGGFLHIITQFNDTTNKINENQRFLFGNQEHWTCYKVVGTGLNDFANLTTYDNDSAKTLTIDLIADFVNEELDDIVLGIADVNTNLYTIVLNRDTASGSPLNTIQLSTVITYNGNTTTRPVTWTSSSPIVATVSGSGLVTMNAVGTSTITATVTGNPAKDTCVITVAATPSTNTDVLIAPDSNFILEGSNRLYSVYLYKNNVKQGDTFTITPNANSVPSTSYIFSQVDGNHFSITNTLRSVTSYLTIQCVSGTNTKTFNVYLRGAW